MVTTRASQQQDGEENPRRRATGPAGGPGRRPGGVAMFAAKMQQERNGPPPPPKRALKSGAKPKGNGIRFSATPQVHEYEIDSPSARRLELRKSSTKPTSIKFDLFKIELEARGIDPRLKTSHKKLFKCFNDELRRDLEKIGIQAAGTNEELASMLELAAFLRRRANLRSTGTACVCEGMMAKLPVNMYLTELERELADRKIFIKEVGRKPRIVALEEALLKESDGLIGDGFDFGRRFVNVEEILPLYELSDKELREELKARDVKAPRKKQEKLELLYKTIEDELEEKVRLCFREELLDELVRLDVTLAPSAVEASSSTPAVSSRALSRKRKLEDSASSSEHGPTDHEIAALVASSKKRSRLTPRSRLPPGASPSFDGRGRGALASAEDLGAPHAKSFERSPAPSRQRIPKRARQDQEQVGGDTLLDEDVLVRTPVGKGDDSEEDRAAVREPRASAAATEETSIFDTPAKRVRRFAEASLQKAGFSGVFGTSAPSPSKAAETAKRAREALEPHATDKLFALLFSSGKWRDDYKEPPCEVKQGSCVVQ